MPFKCFPHCSVISLMFQWNELMTSCQFAWLYIYIHIYIYKYIYKLTQMLETCWYESLQGRAGYIIYSYCMYTIKLKALILSIVFNYLLFLMMKIDCTEFFFLFFACACCCQDRQKLSGWYTNTHSCHTTVAVHPGVKRKKKAFLQSLFDAHHECTN